MKTLKRILTTALIGVLLLAVVGCSTPAVALSVGGYDYSSAEYLAYLYQNASQIYSYYSYFGDASTMWDQTMPYENPYDLNDDDETSEVSAAETSTTATGSAVTVENKGIPIADYIKQATKDQIIYLSALRALLEENKLSFSEADMTEMEATLAGYNESDLLDKGFSLENFSKAFKNTTYLESTVFMGLFGTEGKKAVTSKDDMKAYFDKNYVMYEVIQTSLADSEGKALTDEEIAEKKADLEGYRNVFYATGDFDEAIAAYDAATTADSEDGEKKEYDTDYDGEPQENVTSNTSSNVQTVDVTSDNAEKDLVSQIQKMDLGAVEIVDFTTTSGTKMAALVYRIDPDAKGVTARVDTEASIIKALHQDEFDKLVKAKMNEQKDTIKVSDRALKMCDPKAFFD